jgi:hypothetical protein
LVNTTTNSIKTAALEIPAEGVTQTLPEVRRTRFDNRGEVIKKK